ncbi:MAG TPA: fumarylacetoacetase [Steroidobacteraceae bacterium]|jgi:fumarylacetoacetase|nr:fumarylacetoacetase [Steroidobacteraceae bacterium]
MPRDATHDPTVRSWLASANQTGGAFPIQNLPFGVFRPARSEEAFRGGVAIGDQIIDLRSLAQAHLFPAEAAEAIRAGALPALNSLMQQGPGAWSALRHALFAALAQGSEHEGALRKCLVPQSVAEYSLPAEIGDFTDFYISVHHATAIGRLFRPDNPLLPNYKWVPIGYHGRSSSIVISGRDVRRPCGQKSAAAGPALGPSARLDYELELGIFIGAGNALGSTIPMAQAEDHIFGLCLLNDWSARDLQAWEYQPLGPFLAKNFATTISPWVVTLQALAPFRVPFSRSELDPQPLPYLDSSRNRDMGAIDIRLEALLQTAKMAARGDPAQRLSSTSFRHAYWTAAQLVAHHTVNGCNLRAGDLFGSGTQSGPTPAEAGSLVELSRGGTQPLPIGKDERRTFLEDGDTVIFRGWCERPGAVTIGFGELCGRLLPAAI